MASKKKSQKINSREKGKRGEREFAKYLTHMGFPASRGQQFKGGPESPDVICPDLNYIHWEVKNTERLKLYDALKQSEKEAGTGEIPVVAHKRNREGWVVILRIDDFLELLDSSQPW